MARPCPSNSADGNPSAGRGCVITPMRLSSPRSSSIGRVRRTIRRTIGLCRSARLANSCQKLAANVGPEVVVARADNIGCFEHPRPSGCHGTRYASKPGGSGLRKRPQRFVSISGQGRSPVRNRIDSSCSHSLPWVGAPRTCGAPCPSAASRSQSSTASSWIGVAVPSRTLPALRATAVQEAEQVVRRRCRIPAAGLAGRTRFVRLVQHHHPERFLRQRAALAGIIAVDDQPGRHDPNSPRAFRH